MTRHEFSRKTKDAALERAGWRCEASGPRYGLAPAERCNADLRKTGAEHDHYPLGAHAEGSNTLENDVVCCPAHNQYAANHTDKRIEAKLKRIQRKHGPKEDRRKTKKPIRSRGFDKAHRPMQGRQFDKRRTK